MSNQKKILLLGGSAQQLVAIRTAKRLGLKTVLCDYLPDNPGQYEADVYYNISTTDVDAVYEVAAKEHVDGVLAYASDPAALPAAIVASRLGLPTNPVETVEVLGVKHKFREFLHKSGFACPGFATFRVDDSIESVNEAISNFRYPLIIKPTDSSGSKGVTKVSSLSEIADAIKAASAYSRNKILIAEEFIVRGFPDVVGGDIFVWDGKVELFGEMTCLRGESGAGLVPIGEKKPSGLNDRQTAEVHRELQRLVTALGFRFGELNIEILLDKDDKAHFLELGPRAGGNMIPIQLSDIFGVDLVEANVKAAMGERPNLALNPSKDCFFTYVLHSYESGCFEGVEYDPAIKPYIYREVLYKKHCDRIERFDGAGKAVGILFLRVPTEAEMLRLCKSIENLVRIRLEQ